MHKKTVRRGYIAMLAVDENYRQKKIGKQTRVLIWLVELTFDECCIHRFKFGDESDSCNGVRRSRRSSFGDGNHQRTSTASVRKSRFRKRQALVSLLPKRRGRFPPETLAEMKQLATNKQTFAFRRINIKNPLLLCPPSLFSSHCKRLIVLFLFVLNMK